MNGIHDMGGMQDMGPLQYQKNEPVFHAGWEGRTFAMTFATTPPGFRYQIELIPPEEYLRMSYYEKWLTALVELLLKGDMITRAELETGKPVPGTRKGELLTAAKVQEILFKGTPSPRQVPVVAPLFQTGQQVRARNINPVGHTRLPRYTRGKLGTIEMDYGVSNFPDTRAPQLGDKPQHVYAVRFAARELWGEQASPHDSVYVALSEDYLEPA